MFPIHCIVEVVAGAECPNCYCDESGTVVLVDSYAIVAGHTPLGQLVETVLTALGMPHFLPGAKGKIQLRNWKPLAFPDITDDAEQSIDHLLKDVSNHVTLRIVARQAQNYVTDSVQEMKSKLLRAITKLNPQCLDCITDAQLKQQADSLIKLDTSMVSPALMAAFDGQVLEKLNGWCDGQQISTATSGSLRTLGNHSGSGARPSANYLHGVIQSAPATKFNTMLEVPKLERWFKECSNPSRSKLLEYMHVLNRSNFRKHSTKITYQQICNWFSNARAVQRKKEIFDVGRLKEGSPASQQQPSNGIHASSESQKLSQFIQSLTAASASALASAKINNINSSANALSPGSGDEQTSNTSTSTDVEHMDSSHAQHEQMESIHSYVSSVLEMNKNIAAANALKQNGGSSFGDRSPSQLYLDIKEEQETGQQNNNNDEDNADELLDPVGDSEVNHPSSKESCGDDMADDEDLLNSQISRTSMLFAQYQKYISAAAAASSVKSLALSGASHLLYPSLRTSSADISSAMAGSAASDDGGSPSLQQQFGSASDAIDSLLHGSSMSGDAGTPPDESAYRARSRLMFDPMSEVPVLENWFDENPHPSWLTIDQYTATLNQMAYRQTYPPVTPHNVKIWFKNRRAKSKRLLLGHQQLDNSLKLENLQ